MRLSLAVVIIFVFQGIFAGAGTSCACAWMPAMPQTDACCAQNPSNTDRGAGGCCCEMTAPTEGPDEPAVPAQSVGVQLAAAVQCAYRLAPPVTDGSVRPDDVQPAVPHLSLQSPRIERGPPA